MKTLINWKVFWILWAACVIATLLILPYSLELQSPAVDLSQIPIPLPALIAIQTVQGAILLAVMIFLGLWLAGRVGLAAPILEAATRGEPVADRLRAILPISLLLGILATLVMLALEFFYFQPAMMNQLGETAEALNLQTGQPAAWKGFLASFYGGIAEEVQLRLFVMTLLVWLGRFLSRTSEGRPTNGVFWTANILAAILFGLGHLPTVAMLLPLTPIVLARTIVLNGIGGIAFGWLYWKRGLEAAIIAHFAADIVLHVLLAL
jgi:membrane protease YdiL (CAAX protease family)